MSQQPRSWQEKYLSSLKDCSDLYWYCEAVLPPSMRKSKLHDGWTPVGYPGEHIPVVPVGANWKASRRICDMLCWIFRVHIPYALEVAPVVASAENLNAYGAPWYDYRETVALDCACAICGMIERVPHIDAEEAGTWLCAECIESMRWHEAYREES